MKINQRPEFSHEQHELNHKHPELTKVISVKPLETPTSSVGERKVLSSRLISKPSTKARGDFSESLAEESVFSRFEGATILAKNYRKHWVGELDIIFSYKKNRLVFVEVKTVTTHTEFSADPLIWPRKLVRMKRTIRAYLHASFLKTLAKNSGRQPFSSVEAFWVVVSRDQPEQIQWIPLDLG